MNTNMFRTAQQAQVKSGFAQNTGGLLAAGQQAQQPKFPIVSDQVAETIYPQLQNLLVSLGFPVVPGKVTIGRIEGGNTITLTDFGIKRDKPNAQGKKVKNLMNVTLGWMKEENGKVTLEAPRKETVLQQLEYHQRMVSVHMALVKYMEKAAAVAKSSGSETNPNDGQE